jgi:hypothetical protein
MIKRYFVSSVTSGSSPAPGFVCTSPQALPRLPFSPSIVRLLNLLKRRLLNPLRVALKVAAELPRRVDPGRTGRSSGATTGVRLRLKAGEGLVARLEVVEVLEVGGGDCGKVKKG